MNLLQFREIKQMDSFSLQFDSAQILIVSVFRAELDCVAKYTIAFVSEDI